MNDAEDDRRLVAGIDRGETSALAEAYQRHAARVYSLARRISGSAQLAGDVVEEVFLRLWDHPEEFDVARGSLRAHLLHLAEVTVVRRTGRRGSPPNAEAAARRAQSVLPEEEIQAIELACFGGYSCRQVAELLDVPERTVTSRIRLGLKRLRLAMPENRDD